MQARGILVMDACLPFLLASARSFSLGLVLVAAVACCSSSDSLPMIAVNDLVQAISFVVFRVPPSTYHCWSGLV